MERWIKVKSFIRKDDLVRDLERVHSFAGLNPNNIRTDEEIWEKTIKSFKKNEQFLWDRADLIIEYTRKRDNDFDEVKKHTYEAILKVIKQTTSFYPGYVPGWGYRE